MYWHYLSDVTGSYPFLCCSQVKSFLSSTGLTRTNLGVHCTEWIHLPLRPRRQKTAPRVLVKCLVHYGHSIWMIRTMRPSCWWVSQRVIVCQKKKKSTVIICWQLTPVIHCFVDSLDHQFAPPSPDTIKKATQYGWSLFGGVLFDQGGCSCCGGWGKCNCVDEVFIIIYIIMMYIIC